MDDDDHIIDLNALQEGLAKQLNGFVGDPLSEEAMAAIHAWVTDYLSQQSFGINEITTYQDNPDEQSFSE